MAGRIPRFVQTAALALCLGCNGTVAADAPSWFVDGRPVPEVSQALDLFAAAASHGLEPQDYAWDSLLQAIGRAAQDATSEPATIARLERALTASMQRYLGDLHGGRIDPRQLQQRYLPLRRDGFDAAAVLQAAFAAHRLAQAEQEVVPRLPMYERLREALRHYRELVDSAAWQQALPPLPADRRGRAGKLAPGQAYAGLELLAQRLIALGDLAPLPPASSVYEEPLVAAVQAFQQRHGLVADGVVGRATWVELQVPPAARVRQIELTLERLRWTPVMEGPRMIVINIPEFVLRAYEVREGRISVLQEMKVIVGKALDTRTPMFDADMQAIEFNPYWNVPPSIAHAETVPRLRRDPGYFEREGFEFVGAGGRVDTALTAANLDALSAGRLRIRQRPGPRNALGDIKFVFPNNDHIFLHHTPAPQLFEVGRRDFSHGCIRVEQPVALAKFVLQDMPEWSQDRIRQAMTQRTSMTLRLAGPVRVLIAYGTTLVKGGRIYFFNDIYGQDRRLDAALRQQALQRRESSARP